MKNKLKKGWTPKRRVSLVSSKKRVLDSKNYRKDGLTNHQRMKIHEADRQII